MQTDDLQESLSLYTKCMEEIKKRTLVIERIISGRNTTGFRYTDIDFICLQYRKIFELIVFANLVSNKEEYAKKRASFATDWKIESILKEIEKINPDYYPKPTTQIIDNQTGKVKSWGNINDGFLTKDDLIEAYNECSNLLHAENPFNKPIDLDKYSKKFSNWQSKIKKLLNHHLIQLSDPDKLFAVNMRRSDNGNVQVALFEKQDKAL